MPARLCLQGDELHLKGDSAALVMSDSGHTSAASGVNDPPAPDSKLFLYLEMLLCLWGENDTTPGSSITLSLYAAQGQRPCPCCAPACRDSLSDKQLRNDASAIAHGIGGWRLKFFGDAAVPVPAVVWVDA